MKILKASKDTVTYATARKVRIGNKYHYNIIHGTDSKLYKAYRMFLSDQDFPATEDSPEVIELKEETYEIKPIKNNKYKFILDNPNHNLGDITLDKKVFLNYCIYKTDISAFKDDVILFMEFPYNIHNEFSWRLNGHNELLGYGRCTKERTYTLMNKGIISPVIELSNSSNIYWMYHIDPIYYDNTNPDLDPIALNNPFVYKLSYEKYIYGGSIYGTEDWIKEHFEFKKQIWIELDDHEKELFKNPIFAIV